MVNTDLIRVLGTPQRDRFIVSLAGGPFAPGPTVEPGGLPEIEIEVRLGGQATRDVFEVRGSERPDLIRSGANGPSLDVTLNGDSDEDVRVDGALKLVRYFGFGDADVLGAGRDTLIADDGNPETLDTGPAADSVTRDPFDTVI